jgi:thioredoxin-disulfide reductase
MEDLIIIGAGPAALTAGIYAARKKLKVLMLAEKPSWQLSSAPTIENYPGFKSVLGAELLKKMQEQLELHSVNIKNLKIERIKPKEGGFIVFAGGTEFHAKAIIIASGKNPRLLNVPGEKEFIGKGVGYCVTCDGPIFSGKEVAVIGGGNAGLEAAIELQRYAKKVYLLEETDILKGDEVNQDKLKDGGKTEFIFGAKIKEIKGEKFVSGIVYQDVKSGVDKELPVSGLFVEIGSIPSSDFIGKLADINEGGEIVVNQKTNETKTPGIFAAGDVTDGIYKQIVIACGDGAKAALSAYSYLSKIR